MIALSVACIWKENFYNFRQVTLATLFPFVHIHIFKLNSHVNIPPSPRLISCSFIFNPFNIVLYTQYYYCCCCWFYTPYPTPPLLFLGAVCISSICFLGVFIFYFISSLNDACFVFRMKIRTPTSDRARIVVYNLIGCCCFCLFFICFVFIIYSPLTIGWW